MRGLEERGANFFLETNGVPSITVKQVMPNKGKPEDVFLHFTMAKAIKDNLRNPDTVVMGGAYSVLNNGKNDLQALEPERKSMFYWGNYNIEHGCADMIALGRQSLADPKTPAKYMADKEDEINWCVACDCCLELLIYQQNVGCVVHNKPYSKILQDVRKEKGRLRLKIT
ncbi:hypothetical protein SDC9_195918 [bioreactor metagenome]|uniref:Uncharacterized protein n=1 Tax=bioreactor metagenome TaxID=1076179 RepID=A0A645IAE5_9ZZZZ